MNKSVLKSLAILIVAQVFLSCAKNDEADFLSYSIKEQQAQVAINHTDHSLTIRFPDAILNPGSLTAEFLLSDGATAKVDGLAQQSGVSKNNYSKPFTYVVRSENGNEITWQAKGTNNQTTVSMGLGGFLESTRSNNKTYNWYIDQSHTGVHSGNNCGPASTTMAAKWSNPSFTKTTEDARAAYKPEGGWWYTPDIDNYLKNNNIPHSFIPLSTSAALTEQILTAQLDQGSIAILCVDMYYIRKESDPSHRIDKFYDASTTGWGHFIIAKGYSKVDGKKFFEVYDPYNYDKTYSDGTQKGLNRFYRSEDLFDATSIWWNYAIIVRPYGTKAAADRELDPATIPVMWGR